MKKSQKTKRYIIEKTADIFNKNGYIGTSLSDLTEATGLTKGSIYGNFQDKEEVAISVFNYNYQNLIKKFTPKLAIEKTSKGKLNAFLDAYLEIYEELMRHGGCPILNNAVDADNTESSLAMLSEKAFTDWNNNLKNIIAAGKSSNEISEDIDPQYYADLFISLIEGSLMLSKVTGEKRFFQNAINHLKSIVERTF